MSGPKPPTYTTTAGRRRPVGLPPPARYGLALRALATRIHARADHRLLEYGRPERSSGSDARLPACLAVVLGASLGEVAGASLVWSNRAGDRGALRVPPLESFAGGWRAAAGDPRRAPDDVGYVVIDEVDGGSRGLLVMDERGRCRCVWVPPYGTPVLVARTLDGYLERCLARAARHEWPRAPEPHGIDQPTPEEAASHARVLVRCRDARWISVEQVCARRLASLACHADMARTLRVAPEGLANKLRAMGPTAHPRGLGALLRDSRRGPQSIAELRRWAHLDAEAAPWLDIALDLEDDAAATPRRLARLAWLSLRAAEGGEAAMDETEWRQLMDDPDREPTADDTRLITGMSATAVSFSLPGARSPTGCVAGAQWVAVVPTAPAANHAMNR